jgi:hypothetical protein
MINQKRAQALNRSIVSGVQKNDISRRREHMIATGAIPLSDAEKRGFYKVAWDLYKQKDDDVDGGPIWAVAELDGEQWLVVQTDSNDMILRRVARAYINPHPLKAKVASVEKTATTVFYAGDVVEVASEPNTINWKYNGKRGKVIGSFPDRTALTLGDGSNLWFENKDLRKIDDGNKIEMGDTVRMFSNHNLVGRVTKLSADRIEFENDKGIKFNARPKDVIKLAVGEVDPNVFIGWGPGKAVQKSLQYIMNGGKPQQEAGQPEPEAAMPDMAGAANPAITKSPTDSMGGGTGGGMSMSMGGPSGGSTPPASGGGGMFAHYIAFPKYGRVLIVNDTIQLKSSGEVGTIMQIGFDHKLGKYYTVSFGGTSQPKTVFETDIIKLNKTQGGNPAGEREVSPTGQPMDPDFNRALKASDSTKRSALAFVENLTQQALANSDPSEKTSRELYSSLVKKASEVYINKYMDVTARQVMSADDKEMFGNWIHDQILGLEHAEPITQTPTTNAATEQFSKTSSTEALAIDYINEQFRTSRKEVGFQTLAAQDKFYADAYGILVNNGFTDGVAKILTASAAETGSIDSAVTKHQLSKLSYTPLTISHMLETAAVLLDGKLVKQALGMPGMEALRGGGGGTPGGIDMDPMSWEIKTPQGGAPEDPNALDQALQENFKAQTSGFEEAAPKLDINLDPENKTITIDYNQETKTPQFQPPQEAPAPGQNEMGMSPSTPGAAGAQGTQPGQAKPGVGGGGDVQDFSNMNVPTSF